VYPLGGLQPCRQFSFLGAEVFIADGWLRRSANFSIIMKSLRHRHQCYSGLQCGLKQDRVLHSGGWQESSSRHPEMAACGKMQAIRVAGQAGVLLLRHRPTFDQ
jgi:hypothetical protein